MNDHSTLHDLPAVAGKMIVGPGTVVFGFITLDAAALLLGAVCSLVILAHTCWRWWNDYQDRRAKAAAHE